MGNIRLIAQRVIDGCNGSHFLFLLCTLLKNFLGLLHTAQSVDAKDYTTLPTAKHLLPQNPHNIPQNPFTLNKVVHHRGKRGS